MQSVPAYRVRRLALLFAAGARVLPLLSLLGLLACSTETTGDRSAAARADLITANDFEAVVGWAGPLTPTLSNEHAHSGRYALRVNGANQFSYTYRLPLGQAIPARPRALRLRGWFYRTGTAGYGALVLRITRGQSDENVQYHEMGTNKLPIGRWVEQEMEIPLDPSAGTEDVLTLYLWGPNLDSPLYADDVELTAVK